MNIARRSIKTDCRRAESGGPGRQRFYERMASKGRAPLYVDDILWNFEKFLIDRRGNVIQRFSPDMTPDDPQLVAAIKGALAQ